MKQSTELLENFIEIKKDKIIEYDYLLSEIKTIIQNYKVNQQETSSDFNPIDFFTINENLHSYIISYLLNPNQSHGQEDLFLKEFLFLLEISYEKNQAWEITCEKSRIDIMLKCDNPKSVILIENKSNDAFDQPNQIYRYWYSKIYSEIGEITNNPNFKIIYLSKKYKHMTKQTFSRPLDFGNDNAPYEVPAELIKTWNFENQFSDWISNCINILDKKNNNLRLFLTHYCKILSPEYE